MKIIINKFLPFHGFIAMNLFGVLFVRKEYEHKVNQRVINHEKIHTAQMKELWYLGFYLLYLFFWVKNLFIMGFTHKAYRNIPFEIEAKTYEKHSNYLMYREAFNWKIFI